MILIDRKMPEYCDDCFCNDDYYRCGLMNKEFEYPLEGRMDGCPLRESDTSDDLISRQAAIDAIENIEWYHQNKKKDMVQGANSTMGQPWYKSQDVYKAIEELPSAQPEIIRCKECSRWCICHRSDDWYCADADRRKDGIN